MHDDDEDRFLGGPLDYVAKWTLYLIFALFLVACISAMWITFAHAHGWYPLRCCSGKDCAFVRAQNVKEGPNGYEVIVRPGEHPMVTKETLSFIVPYRQAESSPDNEYHICINGTGKLLCFFAGARSF